MDKAFEIKMSAEHRAKYEALAQKLGIEALKQIVIRIETPEKIRAAVKRDRNLNNIPLRQWDARDYAVRELVRQAGGSAAIVEVGGWSLANSVCVLKHVAKYHVAGWTVEQDDAAPNA